MPSQPKQHHYVPQFYLRQWCDAEGKLVVYPLDGRLPFRTTPRNVAGECNLYTPLPGAPAVRDDHEQWFAGWEGHFAKVWPDIFDRARSTATRMNLARFVATLFIRHPSARDIFGDVNRRFLELAKDAPDDATVALRGFSRDGKVSAADIRRYASLGAKEIRTDWLRQMPSLARSFGGKLFARKWGIVFAETNSFITSDAPVALERGACRLAKFGIATPGTFIFFPISPLRFLVIADEWQSSFMHYKLENEIVFIRRVVRGAKRFVFSSWDSPLIRQAIAEHRATAPQ